MDIIKSRDLISTQICDRFKDEIRKGKYAAGERLPSFGVLADSYGISKSTVHEAFKQLSEEGYLFLKHGKGAYPNPAMIERKAGKTASDVAVIAFGIFSANDNYMIPLLESMHSYAETGKIRLHFHFIRGMSIQDRGNEVLKEAIIYGRFDGIVIVSPLDTDDIKWLTKFKIPFVAATSRYSLPVKQVLIDHAAAANHALDIFAARKVRRLIVFTGPINWEREGILPFARELHDAFVSRADSLGIELHTVACDYSYHDSMVKALTFFSAERNFDGVFFQSDIIAKGVSAAAKKALIDFEPLTVVNYCDLEDYLAPLNIFKPLEKVGQEALRLLRSVSQNDENVIVLKPEMKQ
ncbi:MAG: GntR family transcriptional regulator [Fibrobacteres bacterium]|nr:GntR family transcriptional regulator [Fibrobacterota bacterium]